MDKLKKLAIGIVVLIIFYGCSKEKRLTKYTVEYSTPYYAVSLKPETLIFNKPNLNENIVYKLEVNRIVKLNASVSLEDKNDIWYLLSETDFKGYAKPQNFKLFEDLNSAESFIKEQFPKKESIKASLPLYSLAYKDYKRNDFKNANVKLHSFLSMNKDIEYSKPSAYYTTIILIGNIYIKAKEYQKALIHFQSIKTEEKNNYITLISQKSFSPEESNFPLENITQYIKTGKTNIQKNANINWEILCHIALVYQKKKDYKKAMQIYNRLIKEKKISNVELPYVNFIIDQISKIQTAKYIETLKVDRNASHRYILFKLAGMFQKEQKTKAIKYYKLFIKLFEEKYYKNPYPNETIHYLKAKEIVEKLLKKKEN